MSEIATVGIDLAKSVFQVHGVDANGRILGAPSSRSARTSMNRFMLGLRIGVDIDVAIHAQSLPNARHAPPEWRRLNAYKRALGLKECSSSTDFPQGMDLRHASVF